MAWTDYLLYDLSLIKLCSAWAMKTESDACSLLAKQTLPNLVGEYPSPLIINFKQVIKHFLVQNIYLTFLIDCTFLQQY